MSGCVGLVSKVSGAAVGNAYLQAAGMLFELCDKVKMLPRTDSIAAKRVVLKVRPVHCPRQCRAVHSCRDHAATRSLAR